jgi:TolB-like protein/Tfp pilus assembly protein PilF
MSQTRKLAAILAADVAGYSRLTGLDEEGTLKRLRKLRRELINHAVSLHRGRIVKTTGDGILIEFPSVVEAVRCALDVQRGMDGRNADVAAGQRIDFRVGINLGDVVVEGEDLLGDGVNVAARLEGISKPGGICISDAAYQQVRDKLDLNFTDAGEQKLKNIARPVRAYHVRVDSNGRATLPLPDKPSIAVLPFQNMSGDLEQEYFADGMVEEIITALSRFRQLFVIARNSSFTYKGRAVDVKQISRELGVRYVLEGSVRKAANRVRITAQLIDSSSGVHLWADRFDGTLEDIFELQDQVTERVVGAITPKLQQAEIERAKRKPTESLDAYDYYLRGLGNFQQHTKESHQEALKLFYKAIEIDPDFAAPYAAAAVCYAGRKVRGLTVDSAQEIAEAARLAQRAAQLGKDDGLVLSWAGFVLVSVVGDLEDAAALLDRALMLNPNMAEAWDGSGWVRFCRGDAEVAIEHFEHARRLSPLDPRLFLVLTGIAAAHFHAGHCDEAASWAERALSELPNFPGALRIAAASHALGGRVEQAQKAVARLRRVDPTLRLSNLKNVVPFFHPEFLRRLADGLRKAGLPE